MWWVERIDRFLGIRRPHPRLMFCDQTLDAFRRGDRWPSDARVREMTGRDYQYETLRDTVIWQGEAPPILCRRCDRILDSLLLWRRHLWGDAVAASASPEIWAAVQREFPEWPGFARVPKPEGVDTLLVEGRAGANSTLKGLERMARRLK